MGFKLMQEGGDWPVLTCDVCGDRIVDLWADKASGSRVDGGLGNIVVHHAGCATAEPLHMSLIDFFGLFGVRNRVGDVVSDSASTRIVTRDPGGGFEA